MQIQYLQKYKYNYIFSIIAILAKLLINLASSLAGTSGLKRKLKCPQTENFLKSKISVFASVV